MATYLLRVRTMMLNNLDIALTLQEDGNPNRHDFEMGLSQFESSHTSKLQNLSNYLRRSGVSHDLYFMEDGENDNGGWIAVRPGAIIEFLPFDMLAPPPQYTAL